MTWNPLELAFVSCALVSTSLSAWLFTLKVSDLMRIRRERINGAMLYLTTDKVRHQGFMLAYSTGILMLAVAALFTAPPPPDYWRVPQSLTLICGLTAFSIGIACDALFTYRRRKKMAHLVAEYMGQAGGKRKTDPR